MLDKPLRSASFPDPLARYSYRLFRAFGRYLQWYFRRHFHAVRVSGAGLPRVPALRPLIIYSNHPSWWDPILFALLSTKLFPGRRGFGAMDVRSLRRYPILDRIGVFGVDLGTAAGGVLFVLLSQRILEDPTSVLWVTAEGAFTDVRQRPVRLRQGLAHLARATPNAVVLPLAIEYTFWNESRPEALCCFGECIDIASSGGRDRTVADWNEHFEARLTGVMDQLSAESRTRSPAGFQSLLQGETGVGGFYDWWRRLGAWFRGHRFDSSHGGRE